jgi:serine/threonine protein kinase
MSLFSAPPAAPSDRTTINRIGRFQIVRELGRGALGAVYLGYDPVIDRSVAIKTFNARTGPGTPKKQEQQFMNEARAAGRLSHPNIVTIFDASHEGGASYIAMEYLQGNELSKLLNTGDRFKPNDVATIIRKIADALDYAHKNGVVHRDIKPANIFMVGDNEPKVVDFGIARSPSPLSNQPAQLDQPNTLFHNNLLGTPNYMSPEQAMGQPVDLRTDIYSLGTVMYEMLAGRKPYKSHDAAQLLQMIVHKDPPAPHTVDSGIPVALSNIAMKAMSKRIEKRYQHAEEMALDIKRYLSEERRIRRRKKMGIPAPEQDELQFAVRYRRLLWLSLAMVGTLAIAGISLLLSGR